MIKSISGLNNTPDYCNIKVLHRNCLDKRSYFIPMADFEECKKADSYEKARLSSRYLLLSSDEWNFRYYRSPMDVEKEAVSIDNSLEWDRVSVPECYQIRGVEIPFYVNNDFTCPAIPPKVPEFTPCAVYTRSFKLPKSFIDKKTILSFLGVTAGFTVFVNGKDVGYSQISHGMSQFDITDYLASDSNNYLAVICYKWTDGSFLESQDMFRYNGIFRDVYLTANYTDSIFDFTTTSKPINKEDFELNISVKLIGSGNIKTRLYSDDGTEIVSMDTLGKSPIKMLVKSPKKWSAETPNCYTLYLSLIKDNKEIECIKHTVGFKTIDYTGPEFKINGVPIKIKGINHHDSSEANGYVMTFAECRKDIELMKEFNINTVRFAHYPPHPYLLELCAREGLYAIDEADLESYGSFNMKKQLDYFGNSFEYTESFIDRMEGLYQRDKNNISIIMWSLGNEAGTGFNFDRAYEYLKSVDPKMPVQYETCFREWDYKHDKGYDIVSTMYSEPEFIERWMNKTDDNRPFYLCEYLHMMGTGPGSFKEYWDLVYKYDKFIGGCVWEFSDHAFKNKKGQVKYTYGGDHGEFAHDSTFCVDGAFTPDRKPKSGTFEMKNAYKPLLLRNVSFKGGKINFELYNSLSFLNADIFKVSARIIVDGNIVSQFVLDSNIKPLSSKKFSQSFSGNGSDIVLDIISQDGDNIRGREQAMLKEVLMPVPKAEVADINPQEDDRFYYFSSNNVQLKFSKTTCTLDSYKVGGIETVRQNPKNQGYTFFSGAVKGFVPNIWRAPTDNDFRYKQRWIDHFYNNMWTSFYESKGIKTKDGFKITASGIFSPPKYGRKFDIRTEYVIRHDMSIVVSTSLIPKEMDLEFIPRFGLIFEMPDEFNSIDYYGLGEFENYPDMRVNAFLGKYSTTVEDMYVERIKPQESGNRGGIRYFSLKNKNGVGLKFSAIDRYLHFNAQNFTIKELEAAKHPEELKRGSTLQVIIDGYYGGLGSNACGPMPFPEYRIEARQDVALSFSFLLEPITK